MPSVLQAASRQQLFFPKKSHHGVVGDRRSSRRVRTRLRVGQIIFDSPRSLHSGFDQAGHTCAADADLLAEIERLRERATTYGLVAAVAVALALITVIVASNAQTASAATARASLTPQRPAPKVVSYQSLAPDDSAKEPYQSPFDSPTI